MGHFTYIIQSIKDNTWYYGYSTDPVVRLKFHNRGASRYTKSKVPWRLIFVREFETKSEALNFEKYLKKTRNKEYIKKEFSEYFIRDVAQPG